jgi:hypothetical protein
LFGLLAGVKGDVLLTYDNTREIASLASEFEFETQAIASKAAKHARLDKLLVGNALSKWINIETTITTANKHEQHRQTR